jgi:hypothetical protein
MHSVTSLGPRSGESLVTLIEAGPDALVRVDANGRIVLVNGRGEQVEQDLGQAITPGRDDGRGVTDDASHR